MEVDNVHSNIERQVENKPIYVPQYYIDAIKQIRPGHPYEVHYVDHEFFTDYSKLNFYSSIRPGSPSRRSSRDELAGSSL